ncbi:hypothetical protein RhiirC2_718407 [Rhizophagus irregularis]|uniref:Uncharacterized protein n=1 Tax=Rhizophagus irregularis TaxID=588596 RepID=A0A2N1MII6_9GLOM|nr:hypothetical protein RhiirC2_718407 [Rhizophagus irregularis]
MDNRIFYHDYPNNPYIDAQYTAGNKVFRSRYKIIELGFYLQNVKYTQKRNNIQYQIPDGYIVKTEVANQVLHYETKYTIANKVLYTITWKEGHAKWVVSSERSASGAVDAFLKVEITKLINHQVHIRTFNLNKELDQQPILDDDEYQENSDGIVVNEQEIGNGVYQSIRTLLQTLIPIWNKSVSPILQPGDTINLKLSGDGKEKYETLAKIGHLFKFQLSDLQENGIFVDSVHWPIELFFSGDLKFMYNIMGLNAPNSKYFCLYCDCDSSARWDMNLKWKINKNMQSKKKPELFPAIRQENYIPDELHLLLRISDVLMEYFERLIKSQIEQAMKSINVHFEFFKSKFHSGKWDWTSLIGPDKKKVLQYFPVTNFISGQINSSSQTPGLYRKEDVTPYMHVFSQHIPEFLRNLKRKNLSLRIFSTSSIEKKNHNQVK